MFCVKASIVWRKQLYCCVSDRIGLQRFQFPKSFALSPSPSPSPSLVFQRYGIGIDNNYLKAVILNQNFQFWGLGIQTGQSWNVCSWSLKLKIPFFQWLLIFSFIAFLWLFVHFLGFGFFLLRPSGRLRTRAAGLLTFLHSPSIAIVSFVFNWTSTSPALRKVLVSIEKFFCRWSRRWVTATQDTALPQLLKARMMMNALDYRGFMIMMIIVIIIIVVINH